MTFWEVAWAVATGNLLGTAIAVTIRKCIQIDDQRRRRLANPEAVAYHAYKAKKAAEAMKQTAEPKAE